jgi:pimeloyl-ACP methyl ester carboxylesterase
MFRSVALARFLFLALTWVSIVPAGAAYASDWIEPGDKIELAADEGLVAFVVDSDGEVQAITLDRLGSVFSAPKMPGNAAGRYLRLMKLKEGEYIFNRLKVGYLYYTSIFFNLRDLPNSRFTVQAGKLNYVGDLVARGNLWFRSIGIRNSGLAAAELVDRDFPGLTDRYAWQYVGEYPDDFIGFRKAERQKFEAKQVPEPQLPEPSIDARDWSERLFRASERELIELDPSGRYVFEARTVEGSLSLKMIDLQTSLRRPLYLGPESLAALVFVGSSRVVINLRNAQGSTRSVGLSLENPDQLNPVEYGFGGRIVASVRGSEHEVIVETNDDGLRLFRLDLRKAIEKSALDDAEELNRKVKDDRFWWIDSIGVPRLMLIRDSDEENSNYRYFPLDGGKPIEFAIPIRENEFVAIQGVDDHGRILALTDVEREQTELVEIDPTSGAFKSTVERRPGRDLFGIGFSRTGELASVSYHVNGRVEREMLTAPERDLATAIAQATPGRSVITSHASKNGKRIAFTYGAADPGTYYVYDGESRKLALLAHRMPQLAGRTLAGAESFSVTAADGFKVEALLTRLDASGKSQPLLVIPHGGPMGVFDSSHFDAEVQFFAQLGYAVLQVNYRGSGARGKSVQELGYRELGAAIERDIDLAVDDALKRPGIDPKRIAVLGSSYGGYSAAMLGILKPERYRASVAIAGVFDLALQFSGSDAASRPKVLKKMEEIFGNPKSDYAELKRVSPVYQYERIRNPLLIVHDRGDQRAPFEHARRLQEMLRLRGTPAAFIAVNDGGHGWVNAASAITQYPVIASFLAKALATAPATDGAQSPP